MNTKIASLIAVPAIAAGATAANAQENPPVDASKFSVRLGLNRMTDSSTRSGTGTGLAGALGYQVVENGEVQLEFSQASDGGKIKNFGLSYNQKFPFNKGAKSGTGGYAGVGLGVYRVKAEFGTAGGSGLNGINAHETKTKIGAKIFAGYQINKKVFVEAGFTKIGDVQGADPSNVSLVVGFNF